MFNTIKRVAGATLAALLLSSCFHASADDVPPGGELPMPVDSFVEIAINLDGEQVSGGSGAIVSVTKGYGYVLTAAHVCQSYRVMAHALLTGQEMTIGVEDQRGVLYPAKVFNVNQRNDLCVVKAEGLRGPALKVSQKYPVVGKKYRNIASPLLIAQRGGVPMYEGYYSGNHVIRDQNYDMYSIPARGGSSGSPIMNQRNELTGIVVIGYIHLENCSISPKFAQLFNFMEDTMSMIEESERRKRGGESLDPLPEVPFNP